MYDRMQELTKQDMENILFIVQDMVLDWIFMNYRSFLAKIR